MGKSRPEPMDRPMRWIPVEEHMHVTRAVVLLRLAVALNQDRASAVLQMRTHVYPKRVLLELVPGRGGAELEACRCGKRPITSVRSFGGRSSSKGRREHTQGG